MKDPVVRILTVISVALLAVIVVLITFQNINRTPIDTRLEMLEHRTTYIICLLHIPRAERDLRGGECLGAVEIPFLEELED